MLEQKPRRLFVLDAIKTAAIIMVIITHLSWTTEDRLALGFPFYIDMAVPLFMMVSGFVSTQLFKTYYDSGYSDAVQYPRDYLVKTLLRYTVPYFVFLVLQIGIIFCRGQLFGMGLGGLAEFLLLLLSTGGMGPESYYVPVLIQLVFWFPVIYFLIRKNPPQGLFICFCINLAFEIGKDPFMVDVETYRLLVFRYTFVIACGCYFGMGQHLSKLWRGIFFFAGMGFVLATSYFGIVPKIFDMWTTTSAMSVLFVVPLFESLLEVDLGRMGHLATIIGGATYNIFFSQMLYYVHVAPQLPWGSTPSVEAAFWAVIINVTVGMGLTRVEKPIIKRLQMLITSKCVEDATD